MLNTRLRKQIEWHFKNFKADLALYSNKTSDIFESGLTANFGKIGSASNCTSNPTESKAIRLNMLSQERNWLTVVRNTFNAFRFEPEYQVMTALYIDGKRYRELCADGLWESTLFRWRDKWLEHAYKWVKEFNLL